MVSAQNAPSKTDGDVVGPGRLQWFEALLRLKRCQTTHAPRGGLYRVSNKDLDLTTEVSAETDVSRIGRSGATPSHERTADEDLNVVDWDRVAASSDFETLVKSKARFLIPATIFFLTYYFTLLVLVGFFPEMMSSTISWLGPVNVAYVFALSQFVMVGLVTWAYLREAKSFDALAAKVRSDALSTGGNKKP